MNVYGNSNSISAGAGGAVSLNGNSNYANFGNSSEMWLNGSGNTGYEGTGSDMWLAGSNNYGSLQGGELFWYGAYWVFGTNGGLPAGSNLGTTNTGTFNNDHGFIGAWTTVEDMSGVFAGQTRTPSFSYSW